MVHLAAVTDFRESEEPTELRCIWPAVPPHHTLGFMHFKGAVAGSLQLKCITRTTAIITTRCLRTTKTMATNAKQATGTRMTKGKEVGFKGRCWSWEAYDRNHPHRGVPGQAWDKGAQVLLARARQYHHRVLFRAFCTLWSRLKRYNSESSLDGICQEEALGSIDLLVLLLNVFGDLLQNLTKRNITAFYKVHQICLSVSAGSQNAQAEFVFKAGNGYSSWWDTALGVWLRPVTPRHRAVDGPLGPEPGPCGASRGAQGSLRGSPLPPSSHLHAGNTKRTLHTALSYAFNALLRTCGSCDTFQHQGQFLTFSCNRHCFFPPLYIFINCK